MTRSALALLLVAAPFAVAAPVPKKAVEVVDLSGLQALIAKRAEKGGWSEDDAATLKKSLQTLLDKVAEATGDAAWQPPLEMDTAKIVHEKGPVVIKKPGVYLIDGDVTEVEADECIILATGTVAGSYLDDSVVVAKEIKAASAKGSLLVAAERVIGSSTIGHPRIAGRECVVVAGKRIEANSVFGGVFHVIAPEFPPDAKGKPPVTATRIERDAKLLAEPSDREVGDKRFKTVELKAPIAK